MSLKADLIAAKALIDTPDKWLRGQLADRADTCFCAFGAAQFGPSRSWSDGKDTAATLALIAALPEPGGERRKHPLAMFNDDPATTHADVMALFDRAIEAAS
jgi:hypothetical protein